MNKYVYEVVLTVHIEAFDESDAEDALEDAFGLGDNMGVDVVEREYKTARTKKKK